MQHESINAISAENQENANGYDKSKMNLAFTHFPHGRQLVLAFAPWGKSLENIIARDYCMGNCSQNLSDDIDVTFSALDVASANCYIASVFVDKYLTHSKASYVSINRESLETLRDFMGNVSDLIRVAESRRRMDTSTIDDNAGTW